MPIYLLEKYLFLFAFKIWCGILIGRNFLREKTYVTTYKMLTLQVILGSY